MSFYTDVRDAVTGRAGQAIIDGVKKTAPPPPPKTAGVATSTKTGASPAASLSAYVSSQSPVELAFMVAAAGALIYVLTKRGKK